MSDKVMQIKPGQFFIEETSVEIRRQLFMQLNTAGMSDAERARFYGLPNGCRMREGAKIISPEKLKIGENVWIGENAILDASGGLEIGSNTSIGLGVYLWTHDSHKLNREGNNTRENSKQIKRRPTKIGENCFVAGPSVIMPGVTVADGCIIGPMSVVYKDVKANEIVTPYRDMLKLIDRVENLEKKILEMNNDDCT